MSRWFILFACGLSGFSLSAQVPDPGEMAMHPSPASLAPPPDPVLPAKEKAVSKESAPPKSASAPEVVPDDGGIKDTLYPVPPKPAPDVAEKEPSCFAQVDYLLKHNDGVAAVSYLRQVVTNQKILPQDRARAMIQLADCLNHEHQEAEALCWLKIWMQLYPSRPEFGAVTYRIGTIYTHMGLPNLARDAYYLTLAHTVNEGEVKNTDDLKQYTRLTVGTLWALAANEYEGGQWARAAELFARYRVEATTGTPASLEKAAFLQADCYYQLHQADKALALYEETLQKHPFNPLAPEARLHLYHLYVLKGATGKAQGELEALAWTVRTVWPKAETYWQKQTAQLLLALNQKNVEVLPPLFQQSSSKLSHEGKTWQEALNHYDALVGYEAGTQAVDSQANSSGKADKRHRLPEEDELMAMNRSMDQLLPQP